MVKTTDLVAAMRCSSQAPTSSPPCTTCACRVVELLDGKECAGCDCDRMGMDAADKIEELVDRCARYAEEAMELREKHQWIPVTERLPAEGERVLAAVEGVWVGEAYRDMRDTWMRSYGTPWDASIGMSVTHWMPLPDAPEVTCDG